MPTRHRRIAVTNDPELAEALARVDALFPGRPVAAVVHDLAVKGAAVLAEEEARRAALIERLVERSTSADGFDWHALEHAADAWGRTR